MLGLFTGQKRQPIQGINSNIPAPTRVAQAAPQPQPPTKGLFGPVPRRNRNDSNPFNGSYGKANMTFLERLVGGAPAVAQANAQARQREQMGMIAQQYGMNPQEQAEFAATGSIDNIMQRRQAQSQMQQLQQQADQFGLQGHERLAFLNNPEEYTKRVSERFGVNNTGVGETTHFGDGTSHHNQDYVGIGQNAATMRGHEAGIEKARIEDASRRYVADQGLAGHQLDYDADIYKADATASGTVDEQRAREQQQAGMRYTIERLFDPNDLLKGTQQAVGKSRYNPFTLGPGSLRHNARANINKIASALTVEELQNMKGNPSDRDMAVVQQAATILNDPHISDDEAFRELANVYEVFGGSKADLASMFGYQTQNAPQPQGSTTSEQITPEQARAELRRRRGF